MKCEQMVAEYDGPIQFKVILHGKNGGRKGYYGLHIIYYKALRGK